MSSWSTSHHVFHLISSHFILKSSLRRSEQKKISDGIQHMKPISCDVCGTVCLDEAKFEAHLLFDVHEGYQQLRKSYAELKASRSTAALPRIHGRQAKRSPKDNIEEVIEHYAYVQFIFTYHIIYITAQI